MKATTITELTRYLPATMVPLLVLAGLAGCGSSSPRAASPPAIRPGPAHAVVEGSAPQAAPSAEPLAATEADAAARGKAPATATQERPGLGTGWGERHYSRVQQVPFDRADPHRPTATLAVNYNDHAGARAMAGRDDYRPMTAAYFDLPSLDLTVSLRDGHGRPLPALHADGRFYAIGEAGQRYTIQIKNRTGLRLEAVASVDGLDVLDGKAASFTKRGYLIPPYGTLEIDGWRQSSSHVAAFRFSAVADSYAARVDTDRNVGVIGVALFHERGRSPDRWDDNELHRRRTADPFPNRYAPVPPPFH